MNNKKLIEFWKYVVERGLEDAFSDETILPLEDESRIPDDVVAFIECDSGKEIWIQVKVKE